MVSDMSADMPRSGTRRVNTAMIVARPRKHNIQIFFKTLTFYFVVVHSYKIVRTFLNSP